MVGHLFAADLDREPNDEYQEGLFATFDAASLSRDDVARAIDIVFNKILVLGDHYELSFSTRTL